MTKHTTGAVIFAEGTTVYIDKMGTGRRIAECYAEHLSDDYLTGLREAEANAQLFAAAADLYNAAINAESVIVSLIGAYGDCGAGLIVKELQQALAKVEERE